MLNGGIFRRQMDKIILRLYVGQPEHLESAMLNLFAMEDILLASSLNVRVSNKALCPCINFK